METMLVGAGIVFMAGALIGGGLSAFGVTLPLFDSVKRQVLLFLLGAVLLMIGAYPRFSGPGPDDGGNRAQANLQDDAQRNTQDGAQTNTGGGAETNQDTAATNAASIDALMGPLEEGVNRQGYDFDSAGLAAENAEVCAELCRVNERCVAMTYVVSRRTCWLKGRKPEPKPHPDMISSVKAGY